MSWRWCLLLLAFALATPALAQRKRVSQFQNDDTVEDDQNAKRNRTKNRLPGFVTEEVPVDEPFPWRSLALGVIAFAVAAPFAYTAWKNAQSELKGAQRAFAPKVRVMKKQPVVPPPRDDPE